jgi:periplasmic divalent cation tolerance protein
LQTISAVLNLIRVGCTTLETRQQALDLGRKLVALNLVACAEVVGPVTSVYRWEGKIEESEEWELRLKYSRQNEDALKRCIAEKHAYDEPQWLSWDADASEGYAKWVTQKSKG